MEKVFSFSCKNCGARIEKTAQNIYKCPYCQSEYLINGENGEEFEVVGGTLRKYKGSSLDVIIPPEVLVIGNGVFKGLSGIQSISLPESIVEIGESAFENCVGLSEVRFPKSLISIGRAAFKGSGLKCVVLPEKIKYIGEQAFMSCENLSSAVLVGTLPPGNKIFKDCINLSEVEIDHNNFSQSFMLSQEANKRGDARPTYCDYFQGTPFFRKIKQMYDKKICVSCGEKIKRGYCKNCGKRYCDKGCYIATCVYGSYDCPEVWVLRRYRDRILQPTFFGNLFVRIYYTVSPCLVSLFGKTKLFRKLFKILLDRKVERLCARGVEDTPYIDED